MAASETANRDAITSTPGVPDRTPPTRWDRVEQAAKIFSSLAVMISSLAVPIVLAIIGSEVQEHLQEQSVRRDYVTLAVSILRDPTNRSSPDLKGWAADLLDTNAPVKLSPALKASLQSGAVVLPNNEVAGSIAVTPDSIHPGEPVQLSWNSFNATLIEITPGVGYVSPAGTIKLSPKVTTTYTLNISNANSANTATATVHVLSSAKQ